MRLWASMNYSPTPGDVNPLLPLVFEALFTWDPDTANSLPVNIRNSPGFTGMCQRCTGDADMSLRVAIMLVSANSGTSGPGGDLLYGVQASMLAPKWSTVRESWDSMYSAARNDKRLEQILRWFSYLKNTIEQSVGRLPANPVDRRITQVDDLNDILPEELAMLAAPSALLQLEFTRRLLDDSLLGVTRPVISTEPDGPVFVLLDQSSSMYFLDQRAKGLALALYTLTVGSGRACYLIPFSVRSAHSDRWYVGGPPERFCCSFMDGGTSGFQALNDALDVADYLVLTGSTVIMITDGAFSTTPRTRHKIQKRLEESNTRVGFFLVGLSHTGSFERIGHVVKLGNLTKLSIPSVDEIATYVAV